MCSFSFFPLLVCATHRLRIEEGSYFILVGLLLDAPGGENRKELKCVWVSFITRGTAWYLHHLRDTQTLDRTRTHTHACTRACTHTCKHAYTHTCIHTYNKYTPHTHTQYVRTYKQTHRHVNTPPHTHTHTHAHTHTHTQPKGRHYGNLLEPHDSI